MELLVDGGWWSAGPDLSGGSTRSGGLAAGGAAAEQVRVPPGTGTAAHGCGDHRPM